MISLYKVSKQTKLKRGDSGQETAGDSWGAGNGQNI